MGSLAAAQGEDASYVVNESGYPVVDESGRTFGGRRREPTPEQQAVLAGGSSGLLGLILLSVAWAGAVCLVIWWVSNR